LVWALSLPALADHGPSQRVSDEGAGWTVDDFTLTDQRGAPFTEKQLEGKWTFVLFGDTRCEEPCRAALSALAGMFDRIGRTRAVETTQVLFVSLNAERDSPERLREYLASFDERFVGVTGPSQTLRRLAEDLGVLEALPAEAELVRAGASNYPGSLVLVNAEGVVWGQFLPPFDAMLLTSRYLRARIGR
jgi:protein SCO1/2